MRIGFYGAAGVVTGSKHLITTGSGTKVLLDCGLFQGHMNNKDTLNRELGFEPSDLDFVILSHAHIDHCGLLPTLVKAGFKGLIFATHASISLCGILLLDSAHIQKEDLRYLNKRRKKRNEELLEPLYDIDDVERTIKLMVGVDYDEILKIDKELTLQLTDAGHLLGSAIVNLDITDKEKGKTKITFTGDIGRYGDPILRIPQPFRQCDILICESTYGDRLHPSHHDHCCELLEIVKETCVTNKGKLIIPAFSVDRTQEIIYELDQAANDGTLPNIKVYVDSPLSVKATAIMRKHEECFNDEFMAYVNKDPEPFNFKNLTYITDVEKSKALNESSEPCIIISASGMADAGRIKHHIKNNINSPKNTILLVGYCTPESLGGKLKSGAKKVRIFGDEFDVEAKVSVMDSYSAHADYSEIFKFLECQKKERIHKIFLVHGELETIKSFKEKFVKIGYKNIEIPELGQVFQL